MKFRSVVAKVLFLTHPKRLIRDTQRYRGFRSLFNGGLPSLKSLADRVLGLQIQQGAHDSVSDDEKVSFSVREMIEMFFFRLKMLE